MMATQDEVRLSDLVMIKHGYAFKGEFFRDRPPGDILLSPGNFAIGGGFQLGKLKYYDGPEASDFVLKSGDLLVTMTDLSKAADTLGYPAIVPRDGRRYLHNQRLGKVVLKDQRASKSFIYWLLRTKPYRDEVLSSVTGSTVKHTSPSKIGAFKFSLPTIAEQDEICAILDALDDKIELNRRMNETLEAMAQTIFRDWFVDFGLVRRKIEGATDPVAIMGGLTPDPVHSAELAALFPALLGEDGLPHGWRRAPLGEIAQVTDCLHAKKPERTPSGQTYLQLSNIVELGMIDLKDHYQISAADYGKWVSRMEAEAGDCVITNVGRVGAVAQIPKGVKAALGRNMTGIRCKATFPFRALLITSLLSPAMQLEIDARTDTGTILNALNVKNVPRLELCFGNLPIAAAFESLVRPLRDLMESNAAQNRTLAETRDYLLPRLMSGQVRVGDAAREIEAASA